MIALLRSYLPVKGGPPSGYREAVFLCSGLSLIIIEKTFFSGGDGGAAPVSEAAVAVGECLLERDIDKTPSPISSHILNEARFG